MGESRCGLVQQHAQAVDGPVAAGGGVPKQGGGQRDVDDVGDDGVPRQGGQVDRKWGGAFHAEHRGVDQHVGRRHGFRERIPPAARDAGAVAGGEGFRGRGCPVGEVNPQAALAQRVDDGAGGAPRAQDRGEPCVAVPARRAFVHVGQKPMHIRIAADESTLIEPDGVDGADRRGLRLDAVEQRDDRLFMRDRDVAAGEPGLPEGGDETRQGFGRDVQGLIGALQAVFAQPVAMQQGGAGVADGMADDEGPGWGGSGNVEGPLDDGAAGWGIGSVGRAAGCDNARDGILPSHELWDAAETLCSAGRSPGVAQAFGSPRRR